ncbi:MAG: sulfatase [Bryobacteraceae bacterium]
MNRRTFLRAAVGAAVTLPQRAQARKPNLLFIFCDQLRAQEIGCMGNAEVRTPNIDRLASQGILMRNNFSCAPVCSPFRGSLMTGRYPWNNGVERNGAEINAQSKTIAEVLLEQGYATGFIGKWHLFRAAGNPAGTPAAEFVPPEKRRGWQFWAATNNGQQAEGAVVYYDSPTPVPIPGTEIAFQTRTAIQYMEQHAAEPFALMIAYNPPHVPLTPTVDYAVYPQNSVTPRPTVPAEMQAESRRIVARYRTAVSVVDDYIGQLMAAMDRLGLTENTVLAFTSDHGLMMYEQGQTDKQRPWNESAQTPYIVRYPAAIPAGRQSEAMANSVDLMPTMLALLNVPAPSNVEGVDLSPVMRGDTDSGPDSIYLSQRHFAEGIGFDWQGVVTQEWKYAWHKNGDWLLYNRREDPYEQKNLVDDPRHAEVKQRLADLTAEWRDKTGDRAPLLFP